MYLYQPNLEIGRKVSLCIYLDLNGHGTMNMIKISSP